MAELGLSCHERGLGVWCFLAVQVAFVNSFRRVVRRGVHQALALGEWGEWGALASIVVVRAVRAEENQWSSWLGEGDLGGGGTSHSLSLLARFGLSASCQCGLGLSLCGGAGGREINIRAWWDPVEGRVDMSHQRKGGKICGVAKSI